MGAVRKRFTPAEREAFTVGTVVEWLNSSTWRPGVIHDATIKTCEYTGGQYLAAVQDTGSSTRTFKSGTVVQGYPKHVRLPR